MGHLAALVRTLFAAAFVFPPAAASYAAEHAHLVPRDPATAARADARAPRPVPFKVGESLVYDVSWSSFLTAGSAVLTVREKRPASGSDAYYVVAEGRPSSLVAALYRLYYKADALLDSATLLPQQDSLYAEEGTRRRTRTVTFHQDARTADLEVKTSSVARRRLELPPATRDTLSALYELRAAALTGGMTLTMPVLDGDVLYNVQVTVSGRERIETPAGSFTAWKVTPKILPGSGGLVGRTFSLWVSDDARRLPLRMDADMPVGRFVLRLREIGG
jgi:hypothetical protein